MKLYICPACYKVMGCGEPKLIYCDECEISQVRGNLPCQNYAEAKQVVKNLLCLECKIKRAEKLN